MRGVRLAGWICLGLCLLVQTGCSRAYWRRNADAEAYGLIREKTRLDGRWSVPRTDIVPSPLSRMYDPAHPDFGALPPDDPAAHQYMHHMSDCNRIHGSDYWGEIGMGNSIENPAWVASLPIGADDHVPLAEARLPAEQETSKPKPLPFLERFAFMEMWREFGDRWSGFGEGEKVRMARHESSRSIGNWESLHSMPHPPAYAGGSPGDVEGSHFTVLTPPQVASRQKSRGIPDVEEPSRSDSRLPNPDSRNVTSPIQLATYQEPLAAPAAEEPAVPGLFVPTEAPRPDEPDAAYDSATPFQPPTPYDPPGEPFTEDESATDPADPGDDETTAEPEEAAPEAAEETMAAATAPGLEGSNPVLPPVENLTLEGAVALSYLHGRDYQFAIEQLYIAALDLAFDRFQFDVRFLGIGGNRPSADLGYQGTPDGVQSLTGDARIGISRLLPAGGQWAAELANQTLWLFSDGPNESGTMSTLTFSFVQPLLFAAGRKVVLEDLTQSERNVLYAARDLARFRQEFFVNTVTGGPSGGFLGLLQSIQRISNQEDNIRRLEYQLEVSEANEQNTDALSRTQLESSLLRALNGIRSSRANLQGDLDQFKIQLGLPPDLAMSLETSFLEPFRLIADQLFALESELEEEFLAEWESVIPADPSPEEMSQAVAVLEEFITRINEEGLPLIERDFERVEANLPRRLAGLPEPVAENRERVRENAATDRTFYTNAREQLDEQAAFIEALSGRLETLGSADLEARQFAYLDVLGAYNDLLRITRNLQGIQIGLRTELIALNPFEMPMTIAVGYALTNRVDLMNQRAIVTDARRKVEVAANTLRGVLNVRVEQDISTRPLFNNDDALDFRRTNSTFRAGLSFVAPLDQIAQRNTYRVSQINYQRARRDYMLAEDQVKLSVRQSWRQLQVLKQNFEVARYALRVAAQQYDQAVEETANPDQQSGRGAGQSGLNVINALNSVLGAQNDLIGIWVQYESARLNIYRDMGIMEIDARGMWVDPFYQNGMTRPAGIVEGPPGWNDSTEVPPARLPVPEDSVPIPPVPRANPGVRMNGGGSALSRAFEKRVLPASYLPGRDSDAAAQLIPPKSREDGHVRTRRSPTNPAHRHIDRASAVSGDGNADQAEAAQD